MSNANFRKYPIGEQKYILSRFLDTSGSGIGIKNANEDYSSAVQRFYIQPPSGSIYRVSRILINIKDSPTFRAERYGSLTELTNGVQIKYKDDNGGETDFTDGASIKTNTDWSIFCTFLFKDIKKAMVYNLNKIGVK